MRIKNIGVALGGGAVLGSAHVGFLKAVDELNIEINYISGTSIGAFVAALFAFGKSWKEIRDIAIDLDWLDISSMSISEFGLLKNDKLGDLIRESIGDLDFSDSNIPLSVIATNIGSGEKVVINSGSIADGIMASTAIPGIFVPVEIDNNLLVDGGLVENVPVLALEEMGAEFKIGVDLNAKQKFSKPRNLVDVLINTLDITMMNSTKLQTKTADILITPDLSNFNLYDTDQVADLIEKGYSESIKLLKESFGDD